jgi:GPH family glycoside/pentoside/hexuronide:cation symporter
MSNAPTPSAQPATPPPDRISLRDKIAFTSGVITGQNSVAVLNQMLVPIYQITLGLNPMLIGTVQMIMRLWDAITDPIVAGWSDNARTRWGRRRPFVFAGGILSALVFPLIWMPSADWGQNGLFAYLLVFCLVFLTCHTLFNIPYESLGIELTSDTNERTRLYAFRGYFPPILSLGASWVYAFIQSDFFPTPLIGMRWVALGLGLLMLVTVPWAAVFLRERNPKEIAAQKKIPLLKNLVTTFSNKPFIALILILVFAQLAKNVFDQLNLYAKIYVLYGGDTKAGAMLAGWLSVVYFVVMMFSIGLGSKLAQRYSKRAVMFGAAGLMFLTGFAKLFLYNPDHPYLVLLIPFFAAPTAAVASFMVNAMMADVAFYDQWRTGMRREAMFTATAAWLGKLSFSLSGLLSGIVLVATGFDVSLGGAQSDFTKHWLIIGMVLGSCIPALITFVALLFYQLSPAVMERCKKEIEERDRAQGIV